VKVYEDFLNFNSLNLKYAADTHIHADHLSRTKKLAENYKLQPSMPSNDKLNYPFDAIKDGQIFMVGKVKVKAIHTPGHTLESTCYLVDEKVIFTGDTLFFGGVGRPDLKANNEEAKYKATLLFRSLQKLIEIDQSVILMPGHSSQPISFDSQILQSSLKDVISNTPLLLEKENDFISLLLNRIPATPENYLKIVDKNISGDFTGINPIDLEAGAIRCAVS
jgi:glyoxylase-like metal-dependent hydrolase (beta-lactamase superfamily II)